MAQYDILIKDGMIFDGRRSPRFRADIAIKDGVIAEIGRLDAADADRVLDGAGLNVAPGFIDLHTHYDSQLFWDPYCSTSGWHGVTSVVIGNCGFGFAPVHADERHRAMLTMTRNEAVPLAAMQEGMPWDWETFPEFLDSVDRAAKSVNVLAYVPLNPLMVWAMGLERAKAGALPTDAEHAEMCRMLNEAMDAGARGFSVQRMGSRSIQRDYDGTPMATDLMHDETALVLAQVLADRNDGFIQYTYIDIESLLGGNTDHMDTLVRPHIEEVARVSGRPVIVGGAGEANTEWLQSCREQGLRVYGQGNTVTIVSPTLITNLAEGPNLFDFSLAWCQATVGTVEEIAARLADPAVRDGLRAELPLLEGALGKIDTWVLLRGQSPDVAKYDETPLGKVASAMGFDDPLDAFCEINIADSLMTKWYFQLGSDDQRSAHNLALHEEMAADPYLIPGISDGGAHTKYSTTGHYATLYLMTYVREHGWHTLEEAHWRLSALPAFCAGFADRGTLVVGAPADIVVYDFDRLGITERETAYDYPAGEWRVIDRPEGYHYILVNGEVTLDHGAETNTASGQLLRHGSANKGLLSGV
jgi:N-acyl-D-amino-acid deacylase